MHSRSLAINDPHASKDRWEGVSNAHVVGPLRVTGTLSNSIRKTCKAALQPPDPGGKHDANNPRNLGVHSYQTLGGDQAGDFQYFPDFLRRLQPLVTPPENPQILVILCENGAIGGIYILT